MSTYTITISDSDDEKDVDNFKVNQSKPRPSLPFKRRPSTSKNLRNFKQKEPEKEPPIEVRNSQNKKEDFQKIKEKYSAPKKTKKSEVPNVFSPKFPFTKMRNSDPPPLVDLDVELDKKNETETPVKTDKEKEKPINVPAFISNLLSPSKTTIPQKSKILEKEFLSDKTPDSSAKKSDKKAFQNPFSSGDKSKKSKAMITLPIKRPSSDRCIKEKVTLDPVNHVNKSNKLDNDKKEDEGIEIVNLDEVAENDTNKTEAVHETETKMEIEENRESVDVKRKREVEAEDKENDEQTKRQKIEVNDVCEVYQEFIEVVKDAEENDGDREKLLKKLNKNYASAHRNYTMSAEFRQLLQKSIKKIKADKVMLYHMVKDVLEKLKSSKEMKGSERKRVALQPANEAKVVNGKKESPEKSAKNDEASEEEAVMDVKTAKVVRKLEKTLKKLEKKIKKLEDGEVDLDDESDSHYLKMQKYRERFCQVYNKYCEYLGVSPEYEEIRKVPFSGTKYPAVNKCLERWLNKKKQFPDYAQVLRLIQELNDHDKLNLSPEGIRTLAEDAFTKVGEMLKRKREYEFFNVMFSILDEEEDPAQKDPNLEEILRKNNEEYKKKMADLLNYYTEKQVNEHYVAEEVPDDEAENSPVESGDEDDKEIEDVENSLLDENDNEPSDQEEQPEEEKKEGDADNGSSTTEKEKPGDADTTMPPSTETSSDSTPVKESKNNYKHCKSLKWRRENSLKVNSVLCNGDDKSVSDGDANLNGIITENGEIRKEDCESAGEGREPEKPRTESEGERKKTSDKDANEKEETNVEMESSSKQDVECEIIDLDDSPKNNESTYELLKNDFKQQTFIVNYVSVEYSFKNFQQRLIDKNPFDRVSHGFPFRANLDKYIYLNDDGFRDLKILKKDKENRSPDFCRSKADKPFRKKIKKDLFVNKCVLDNEENKEIVGDGQGKEEEETGNDSQEGGEAQENENSTGSNGSGDGNKDGGDEDRERKMDEEEEGENEEQEEEEKQDQEDEGESGENGVNGPEEREEGCMNGNDDNVENNEVEGDKDVDEEDRVNGEDDGEEPKGKEDPEEVREARREECLNGNYDADTDEDNPKESAEEPKESENAVDFDEKLKAFEEALENEEEDEMHKNNTNDGKVVRIKQEKSDEIPEKEERMKAFEKALEEEEEEPESCEKNVTVKSEPRNEEPENETEKPNNVTEEEEKPDEKVKEEPEDVTEKPDEEPKNEETPPEPEEIEEPPDGKQNDKTESEVTSEMESKTDEEDTKYDEEEAKHDEESERRDEDDEMNEDHDTTEVHEEAGAEDKSDSETKEEDSTEETKPDEMDTEQTEETNEKEEETTPDLNEDEPGPSKRKLNEEIEVLEFKKSKTVKDPFDEEIVQNFLRQAPSSISITPPKKFLKPPSQEALNALAALKQLKGVSTTRVRRRPNEPDVQVIGESSKRKTNNGPISITRIRNPPPQQINRNRGVPVISNVQSMNMMNRNNNLTPKIVTVRGNVSGFHNASGNVNFGLPMMGRNFNFGVPRMTNNMNMMNLNMNMNMRIPGLNHFPGFNNQFNNISMFNNRQIQPQSPLKISNVRGNISQTFRPQLRQQQPQQRRFVFPQTNVVRQSVPSSTVSSSASKDKNTKKPVEYVVLD